MSPLPVVLRAGYLIAIGVLLMVSVSISTALLTTGDVIDGGGARVLEATQTPAPEPSPGKEPLD